MKYRIAAWAGVGFLVTGCWALYGFAMNLSANDRMREFWTLVCITCPVAIAGMHFPISLCWTLVANAATYALVGLMVETMRHSLSHAK